MRVVAIDDAPRTELLYRNAASGGGTIVERLQVVAGRVDRLPEGLDALLVTSDLQGVMPSPISGEVLLAGEALAEHLEIWFQEGDWPQPERTGVLLAGDLFSSLTADRRGATGDVLAVWSSFVRLGCPLVVGVAGNHDTFEDPRALDRLLAEPGVALLDGALYQHSDLCFGGVGYIMGNPAKVGRRSEEDFLARLDRVLSALPDVLILHQGPSGPSRDQRGDSAIQQAIVDAGTPLTICGHVSWNEPLAELPGGCQVLNVDGRVLLLR